MAKIAKKAAVAMVTVGLIATSVFTTINANEVYDDASIGITSSLDRYVESVKEESTEVASAETMQKTTKKKSKKKSKKVEETVSTAKYPEFEGKCLTTVSDSVNIRTSADETSDLVGILPAYGQATVIEKGDTWTEIESGSVKGYIRNDFLVFGDDAGDYAEAHCPRQATVNAESLNVREIASEDGDLVTQVASGAQYVVIDRVDGWVGIAVDSNTYGYVSEDYVSVTYMLSTAKTISQIEEEIEAERLAEEAAAQEEAQQTQQEETVVETTTQAPTYDNTQTTEATTQAPTTEATTQEPTTEKSTVAPAGSTGTDLATFALQFVGNPYVYGGSSLTNGADCSGFVMAVYAEFGYSLPHSAGMQSGYGVQVSESELQPGDLIFYGSGSIEHVAIYTGGGMVVHASTAATGIKTSVYNYRTPYKCVRILGQ